MSENCKSTNEELFQSNIKTKQHESIMQNERIFSPKLLENATVQHENFQSETFENRTFNVINENNHIVSEENSVKSSQPNNISTDCDSIHFKTIEKMEINETLNDNISRLNFNIISTELFGNNHTQSKNDSSNISRCYDNYSLRSSPKSFIMNVMDDNNKFSSRSSVDSRVSTPSWAVESNSNFPIDSDNRTFKQAKIKSCGKNNGNNRKVTFMGDLNHERVSEEQMQTVQFDEKESDFKNKNGEKVEIYKIASILLLNKF
jgi:hypothetical protein